MSTWTWQWGYFAARPLWLVLLGWTLATVWGVLALRSVYLAAKAPDREPYPGEAAGDDEAAVGVTQDRERTGWGS